MISYNKIKYFSWKFLVFLFFVLVFGRGSSLVVNFDPRINPVGFILYIGSLLYMANHCNNRCVSVNSPLKRTFWLVLFIWSFIHIFILDGGFPIVIYGQFLLHFLAGILIIKTYGQDIGVYFEKAMVLLSIISIAFWGIESVGGYNLLLKFPILLDNTLGNSEYSIVFYTLGGETGLYGYNRNSGCAWEPGLFSVMLCIALLFNIFRNNRIRFSKNFVILLITLITTFSTTGYAIAIVLFACIYTFSRRYSLISKFLYLCVLSVVFVLVNRLPFMSDKIENRSQVENFAINSGALEWNEKEGNLFTVDRFEGLYLDFLNFSNKPVWGYGLQREKSYVYKEISPYILTSNGIIKPFAQFGLLLCLILFLLTYYSSVKLSKEYTYISNLSWLLFVVIIVGSVSYMFDSTPIMRAIELYALYNIKYNNVNL